MKLSLWMPLGALALSLGGLLGFFGLTSPSGEPLPVVFGTPEPASQPAAKLPSPYLPAQGVSGIVKDGEGHAVPFARVHLWSCEESEETRADGEGRFSFPALAGSALGLLAEAPGRGRGVLLAPILAAENDIVVAPPAVVGGVVLDENGAPLAGAEVALIDEALGLYALRGKEGCLPRRYFPESLTRSGPDGRFQLQSVRAGMVAISASAGGRPAQRSSSLQVLPGMLHEVQLSLPPGRTLFARVLDGQGRPIAGAGVEAIGYSEAVATDPSGNARLKTLPQKPVFLRVFAPGYVTATVTDSSDGAPLAITLRRPAVVAGEILGAARGALVLLVPEEAQASSLSSFAPPRPFRLEQGSFRIEGVAPGQYEIWLQTEHAQRQVGEVTVSEGEAREGIRLRLKEQAPALEQASCEAQFVPSFTATPRQGVLLVRAASARSGVIEGDRILAVDGLPVASLSEEGVWEWRVTDLSGPRGSRVRLTVERPGSGEILHIETSRETKQPGC